MKVNLIQREKTIIGGFSVETTLENSGKKIEKLYKDFANGKMQLLNNFTEKTNEYYGIPEIGYKPIEKNDVAFEYYPNGLDGNYELWSLVEKNVWKNVGQV